MKKLLFCFFIALFLLNCKEEESLPVYTFKGQFINATENTVPIGLKVTLEASSGPNAWDFKTAAIGSAITDSLGRFTITYTETKLPILRLLSQFYTATELPINVNVDTVFYKSTKGTLVFVLSAENPLKSYDTLYIAIPPLESGQQYRVIKLPGPLSSKEFFKYKSVKDNAVLQYYWGIGHVQWDSIGYFSHKYSKNKLIYFMRGDPFIDTIRIKYR